MSAPGRTRRVPPDRSAGPLGPPPTPPPLTPRDFESAVPDEPGVFGVKGLKPLAELPFVEGPFSPGQPPDGVGLCYGTFRVGPSGELRTGTLSLPDMSIKSGYSHQQRQEAAEHLTAQAEERKSQATDFDPSMIFAHCAASMRPDARPHEGQPDFDAGPQPGDYFQTGSGLYQIVNPVQQDWAGRYRVRGWPAGTELRELKVVWHKGVEMRLWRWQLGSRVARGPRPGELRVSQADRELGRQAWADTLAGKYPKLSAVDTRSQPRATRSKKRKADTQGSSDGDSQ